MANIFGRRPTGNVIDQRAAARSGGRLAAAAGLLGLVGSAAAGVGFAGIEATLCLLGVGDCSPGVTGERKDALKSIVVSIVGRTEDVWSIEFAERGETYRPATVILYDQPTETGCGLLPAGASPTYCKNDERVYIDFAFFDRVVERYGASGDAIPAFIVAHEIAHHVQNLNGDFDRYLAAIAAYKALGEDAVADEDTPNQLLTRFELQADCIAGVSAARAQQEFTLLDAQDVEDAIAGAVKLGDDNIQRVESGFVNEESFTHGTGEQRLRWLERGFFSGDIAECDTWTTPFGEL